MPQMKITTSFLTYSVNSPLKITPFNRTTELRNTPGISYVTLVQGVWPMSRHIVFCDRYSVLTVPLLSELLAQRGYSGGKTSILL